VKDTVAGFIAVATSERTIGEVINIGSNLEVSIGETAKILSDIMEVNLEVVTTRNACVRKKVKWKVGSGQP